MRKFFSLFAVMLVALAVNAKVWNIDPGHNPGWASETCNLQTTLSDYAQDGDTIIMADGNYMESYSPTVSKNVVVKAEEGKKPVVKLTGYFQFQASAKFEGITFDHTDVTSNSYCFYIQEKTQKNLIIENCEFKGFNKYCFSGSSSAHVDSIVVNNSYFHNLTDGAFYLHATKNEDKSNLCDYLEVTNSTFANITISNWVAVIDFRNNDGDSWAGNENKLVVDHCTFYNCYGDYDRIVQSYKSANATINNCIFANDALPAKSNYPTYLYGGSVSNCLAYNTYKIKGRSGATFTDTIRSNPQFIDAANNNFMLATGSQAIGAATDGSNIGDPHWNARKLYLKPGLWNAGENKEKYAVWCHGSGSHDAQWFGFMTKVSESDLFETTIPAGFSKVNFVRLNGEAADLKPEWNNKWNQTQNMDIVDDKDVCIVSDWNDAGSWLRFTSAENGYYVIGLNSWDPAALTASTKMVKNGEEEEWKLENVTLTTGQAFKVVEVVNNIVPNDKWFGAKDNNNYDVTDDVAGVKTIYFRPTYKEEWAGHLYVQLNGGTSIDNTDATEKAVKFIENGQLFIIKNGVKYNVLGAVIH